MKKVILITGASSGIGKATAKKLIKEGHTVYCAARSIEKMQDLKELGGFPLDMDVTKEETIKSGIEKIIEKHSRIDVLFNNAGFGLYGAIEDIPLDEARYQYEVNIFGLARVTQLVLPHMRKQNSGKIINTSSMGGKIYTPLGAWYHSTKHALEGWSDCLRLELKQFNIDVVIIEPGLIETEFGSTVLTKMVERSKNSPYEKITKTMANAVENTYEKPGNGSSPEVVANTVSKAINARKPKTRYGVGKLAIPMMFIRKLVSDRMFDRIIMSRVK